MTYQVQNNINLNDLLKITRPDGSIVYVKITGIGALDAGGATNQFTLDSNTHNFTYTLDLDNFLTLS